MILKTIYLILILNMLKEYFIFTGRLNISTKYGAWMIVFNQKIVNLSLYLEIKTF